MEFQLKETITFSVKGGSKYMSDSMNCLILWIVWSYELSDSNTECIISQCMFRTDSDRLLYMNFDLTNQSCEERQLSALIGQGHM